MISNLNSETGGALSITESSSTKNKYTGYRYVISNCTFKNNSASNGGALYFEDVSRIYIGSSTLFDSNYANENGGAIDFYCSEFGVSNFNSSCSLTLSDNVVFMNNKADEEGGAIKWNQYEPIMTVVKISFVNNSAGVYGNNIASVAKYLQRQNSSRMLTTQDTYKSGG